jgi:hypothetical protein
LNKPQTPRYFDVITRVDTDPDHGGYRYATRVEFEHEGARLVAGQAVGGDFAALGSWARDNARTMMEARLMELTVGVQESRSVGQGEDEPHQPTATTQQVRRVQIDYHKIIRGPGRRKGWGVSEALKARLDANLDKGMVTQLMLCDHNHKLVRTFLYTETTRLLLDEFMVPEHFYLIHEDAKGG